MPHEDAYATSGLGFQPEVKLRRSFYDAHRQDAYATRECLSTSGLGFQPEMQLKRSSYDAHRQDAYAT